MILLVFSVSLRNKKGSCACYQHAGPHILIIMYLKSLALQGFKSFLDKTKIEFHPGVTGIVGPNGCGKSNVVDAIRWVLGETSAKALRGGEMSDVIFNGTDRRKPVGMAEVTLTLADCEQALGVDYNEVAITRRVHRDGNSEYRLNGGKCRLKDILDLLMDTGIGRTAYSIMEQGKIDMLLSSKPEDRRAVFEEAAGITKFKSQKKEALRKLDYTEANLLRIEDIIAEVKRQMGTLQRQAQKAKRYQALLTDVKILDTHLGHRKFEEFGAHRAELENSLAALRREYTGLEDTIRTGDDALQGRRDALRQLEQDLNEHRELLGREESTIQAAESRIAFNAERAREMQELIEQGSGDLEGLEKRLGESEKELSDAEVELAAVIGSLTQQRQQLEARTQEVRNLRLQRTDLEGGKNRLTLELKNAQDELIASAARLESRENQLLADRERLGIQEQEVESLRVQHAEKKSKSDHVGAEVDALEKRGASKWEELTQGEQVHREAEAALQALRRELDAMRGEHTAKESRRDVLRQLIAEGEGLREGTREVLKGFDDPDFIKQGVRGVLGSFIEVEESCVQAVEAAMGNLLQTVIVADTAMAESIIDTLTEKELGNVSLVSEDFVVLGGESQMLTVPGGAIAWALDRIKVHDSVRGLMEALLGGVLIVEDLATALRLKREMGCTAFVTPRGDFVSAEGVISGGHGKQQGSILGRENELRRLESETGQLEIALGKKLALFEQRDQECLDLHQQVKELRQNYQEIQNELANLVGVRTTVDGDLQQVTSRIDALDWEISEIRSRLDGGADGISALRERRGELQALISELNSKLETEARKLAEIVRQEEEIAEHLATLKTSLAVEERAREGLEEQKRPIAQRLEEFRSLIQRRSHDITSHRERILRGKQESSELNNQIQQSREEAGRLKQVLTGFVNQRSTSVEELAGSERELAAQRARLSEVGALVGKEDVEVAKVALRMENLEQSARERYQVELSAFEPDPHTLLLCIEAVRKAHAKTSRRQATMAERKLEEDTDRENEAACDSSRIDAGQDAGVFQSEDEAEEAVAEAISGTGGIADGAGFVADPSNRREQAEHKGDGEQHAEVNDPPADGEDVDLSGVVEEGPDWAFVEMAVGDLRRRLDSIGAVNLDAIDEFEELEERHRFLVEQHADLVNSREELLRVISKINTTTKQMFSETFEAVRANFSETFKELFGRGARANLILVDESNPLESGIEVIAKPPGKKLQSISLLSGGERSMTAVALLFSIYMVKPSPFCVLDELDAPLDESNISRFLKMLDRFIDQSQFIIVTHNKRTMRRVDVMYGITMEEFGVSKPVGMRLEKGRSEHTDRLPSANAQSREDEVPAGGSGVEV